MEKYSHCTSTEFKTDISKLCTNCPLTDLINEGIKNQILFQAFEQKDILTDEQFKDYIEAEIKNAKNAMQQTILLERQHKDDKNDPYRVNRSKRYIWNKERIKALNNITLTKLDEENTPKFTMNEIALKFVYEGKTITRDNGNTIAQQYGYNSGEKLFQRFTFYSSTANRKGKPINCTQKKLLNKIELFEKVIETLSDEHKKRAIDEVNILNQIMSSEY